MRNVAAALGRYANFLELAETDPVFAELSGLDPITKALAMQHLAAACEDLGACNPNDIDEDVLADWSYDQIERHALANVTPEVAAEVAAICAAATDDFDTTGLDTVDPVAAATAVMYSFDQQHMLDDA